MTQTLCVVAGCSRPQPRDQFMCRGCVRVLERRLGDVPALWHELEVTLTRQDAIGSDEGRKSADSGLPFKPNASEARWVLANTIGTWARVMSDHAGISRPPASPARWLLINVQSIAMHPAADEAFDEISAAVSQAYRAIDRIPDLLLAGVCNAELGGKGCESPLYARPSDDTVTCPVCDTSHETAKRRDAMAEAAEEKLVPADIALSLATKFLGHVIPSGTWRSWCARGRILPHGLDTEGRPTYQFGEVRVLAEEWHDWITKNKRKRVA
jgi:hypothetical protein